MSDLNEERLAEIQRAKEETAKALKGKELKNLNGPQKDKLIETMAKILGLID